MRNINIEKEKEFLENRIIMLDREVNSSSACEVISSLLYLEKQDPDKDIILYINSPGGVIYDGLAICDTIKFIKPDVQTVCVGMAASMASIILAAGTPGKRYALPHSVVMIHQPLSGASGQITDIQIRVKEGQRLKDVVIDFYSEVSGKSYEEVEKDIERDNYLTAEQAKEYGLIDHIISKREEGEL